MDEVPFAEDFQYESKMNMNIDMIEIWDDAGNVIYSCTVVPSIMLNAGDTFAIVFGVNKP